MKTLNQIILAFIILIEAGGSFRIVKIIVDIIGDPDTAEQGKKKIKNVLLFMILSVLIMSLKEIAVKYYS